MRQHVNPLSKNFNEIEIIPPLNEIFENPQLPLHIDIGSASGEFLFDLALKNTNWNYIGIEIREKLVFNAKLKMKDKKIRNLYFTFGNANNILNDSRFKFLISYLTSISLNFPDPWFKKKHHKRRVIQPYFINLLANLLKNKSLIFIKTDVKELFEYMDFTILDNLNFKKLNSMNFNYAESFNPNKMQTSREKYIVANQINIFEGIYAKI